ncbi:coiled-coil and C2 domain-containing protein 1-like isoform X1 [Pocillopora damicornis]|uniref:coiled-coil and C2 domain-containing protein 1-like isoform X1 n=1 Tax=Pocillopora damicornis TaxID=46731 RepID=UPI000F54CFBD|nr:coiled-coil and C2 domain-containing protein 1-like isoform X1 [Pocillopora damicornis]
MFSRRKKSPRPQEGHKKNDLSNLLGLDINPDEMAALGIGGIGIGNDDDDDDEDEDDESLEAELAALQGQSSSRGKKKKPGRSMVGLDEDDFGNDDDDDDEIDENDPQLLAELQCIAPGEDGSEHHDPTPVLLPSVPASTSSDQGSKGSSSQVDLLLEREKNYKLAIENANKAGEGSKARRYGRGLKEIEQMIKQAKAGKAIDLDAVPPPVATGAAKPSAPVSSQPVQDSVPEAQVDQTANKSIRLETTSPEDVSRPVQDDSQKPSESKPGSEGAQNKELFMTRRNQYRVAALTCKKAGEIQQAKQFLAVSKQIDSAIELLEKGEAVDISQLPPVPSVPQASSAMTPPASQESVAPPAKATPSSAAKGEAGGESSSAKSLEPPPPPKNVAEALQQRLEKYQQAENQAKQEGNSSKARRMGRIVKQYQDAIKSHKAGKPVDYEELPTPPGYAPIPGVAAPEDEPAENFSVPEFSEPRQGAAPQTTASPSVAAGAASPAATSPSPQPALQPTSSVRKSPGRNEQQLNYLLERQKEFKTAALQSKKQGDLEGAKNYLRMSKGLDRMILSAQNGLKVDLGSVPPSPFAASKPAPTRELSFEMVQAEDCEPNPQTSEEKSELFSRLEDALIKQIEMCARNAQHYQKLGDITNTKNFDKMAKNLRQDLDSVQSARKYQDPPPKFHYEDRSFTIVDSFPDLSDSEVELTIVRGLNIPLPSGYQPKDMYTYVSYEFPFPSADEPQTGRTQTIKHSINPDYKEVFKVQIDRKNRSLGRIFKRQPVKFEVKYERGFLKGDKALGQVQVKLTPFDNKCEIHDCFDVMDTERGRKAVGGKLEVHMRIREPLVDKDVKVEKWKWLVIDVHLTSRKAGAVSKEPANLPPKPGKVTRGPDIATEFASLEVLKLEKQIAEKQIAAHKAKGEMPPAVLIQRCKLCQQKIAEVERTLSSGDKNVLINYIRQLQTKIPQEHAKAQQVLKAGNRSEAQLCLTRRKLMENEVSTLKSQLGMR